MSIYKNNKMYPFKIRFTKIPDRGILKGVKIENQSVYFGSLDSAISWSNSVSKDKTICDVEISANIEVE